MSHFVFQPVFYDWYNKGHGMCYPVCGMMDIKEPLLIIGNSSPCGGCGFPLSLSEWSSENCIKYLFCHVTFYTEIITGIAIEKYVLTA